MSPANTALPPNFITLVKHVLAPVCASVDERKALLIETFAIRGMHVTSDIALDGAPNTFAANCAGTLLSKPCFEDGTHPLGALLETIRAGRGVEAEAEIDALVAQCSRLCVEPLPRPNDEPLAPGGPTQSAATPRAARKPAIFVSYAREDAAAAGRLIDALRAAGHACWIDTTVIKGGDDWLAAIAEGINNAYAVVALCSHAALASRWVQDELLWARQKAKRIVPVLLEDVLTDERFFGLHRYQAVRWFGAQSDDALRRLIADLPAPPRMTPASAPAYGQMLASRRALELAYLDRLRFEELLHTERYTPLAGSLQRTGRGLDGVLTPVVARPEFEHTPWQAPAEDARKPERFENAVEKLLEIRRAAILGDPGAGKTTTLWALARKLVDDATADPEMPLPLLIRLGRWTQREQTLPDFIAGQLGDLGSHLGEMLGAARGVALLLDGLNEIPVAQRAEKSAELRQFLQANARHIALVTCRAQDYTSDLRLDRVEITPLDPARIRAFCARYLGEEKGEVLFWTLAGDVRLKAIWEKWRAEGRAGEAFWQAPSNVSRTTSGAERALWRKNVGNAGSLMKLAANPYMLFMLTQVFVARGDLPANRGQLFTEFVDLLLIREQLATRDKISGTVRLSSDADGLPKALAGMAFAMQRIRETRDRTKDEALTVLSRAQALEYLSEAQLYASACASLVESGQIVRFTHQLLQEYFAVQELHTKVLSQSVEATELWPATQWWERNGWEEACVLMAGMESHDCSRVLNWLADAQPEVAAQCVTRSGAATPEAMLLRLRERWLPRLSDVSGDLEEQARAAVGRALGQIRLESGELLDNRRGVGVILVRGQAVPDIDWVNIPAGDFLYGEANVKTPIAAFRIARYPITYAQFQCFVDAGQRGFYDARWWKGLSASEEHRTAPEEQAFLFWNHPRERVSWYAAVAFCRWLSETLGFAVTLPTEQQWERAARFTDSREYPWGNTFKKGLANTVESSIQQTSMVGIYPQGESKEGIHDLIGNVWEWCMNEFSDSERTQMQGDAWRVLRGGSWFNSQSSARAVSRHGYAPYIQYFDLGFRVVSASVSPTR